MTTPDTSTPDETITLTLKAAPFHDDGFTPRDIPFDVDFVVSDNVDSDMALIALSTVSVEVVRLTAFGLAEEAGAPQPDAHLIATKMSDLAGAIYADAFKRVQATLDGLAKALDTAPDETADTPLSDDPDVGEPKKEGE